jgi:hypothetical protein
MKSKEIAETGVFCALTVVILFMASISPVNKLFIAAVSAFLLELFRKRNGVKIAVTVYITSALLAFLIIPYKSFAIMYLTVFGGYVILRNMLEIKSVILKKLILLASMNGMIAILYFFADQILEGSFVIIFDRPTWQIIILFFVLQLAIFFYDYALSLAIDVLEKYFKKMGI